MAKKYKQIKEVIKEEKIKKYNWKDKLILVCEDTETSNMYFKAALKKTNASVLWAENGKEAVEICEKNKDIDLVLMDIRMPEMDGVTATRIIKEKRRNLPIIIQTAYFYQNEKENSYDAGCDEFITKPIKLSYLLANLDKYLS